MATLAHKSNMQKHFNSRASERLGVKSNRIIARKYIEYLMPRCSHGLSANAGRYWFYVCYCGAWSWVLLSPRARRLVTILDSEPHGYLPEDIEWCRDWGVRKERPWNKEPLTSP